MGKVAVIYTYGEPLLCELIKVSEAQKYTNEDLFRSYYRHQMPDGELEDKGITPIWITGNGDIFIKDCKDYSEYLTEATVHYEWKKKLHQRIAYATKIYFISCFRKNGTYMSREEREELYNICVEIAVCSNNFDDAVQKLKEREIKGVIRW